MEEISNIEDIMPRHSYIGSIAANISFDKSIRISEVQHPGHGGSSICPDLGEISRAQNQIEEIRTLISSIFGALSIGSHQFSQGDPGLWGRSGLSHY